MKGQGYGQIIAMSSVAGEKVRRSNFVYGSTKAGLDGFYRLLGDALAPFGPEGAGGSPRPGAHPDVGPCEGRSAHGREGAAGRPGRRRRSQGALRLIWVPSQFKLVMFVLKHIPGPIFRLLPL